MADVIAVPTLSAGGWVTRLNEKMDFLMSYIFEADNAESYSCPNQITSVQAMIQQYGNDPIMLQDLIRSRLERYFGNYYPEGAVVQVSTDAFDESNLGSRYSITLRVSVTESGKIYSAGKLIETLNGKFQAVSSIINA